jgi:hypothetical protein
VIQFHDKGQIKIGTQISRYTTDTVRDTTYTYT